MKNLLVKIVFVCFIFGIEICTNGKEIPHFREKVEIPLEIAKAKTLSEVQPYLESPNGVMRIAAARRLGQLGDPNAASFLSERFAKEPYEAAMDSTPYVKIEIIEALGKIGGEQAKTSLMNIFDTYWKQGPKSERYVWEDSDYARAVPAILEALYAWKDDKKIINLYKNIYLQETNIPNPDTREKAYELYLRADMSKRDIVSPEKVIEHLSPMLTGRGEGQADDWVKGKNGEKTLKAIKDGAMVEILIKCGEPALPFIDKELSKISVVEEKRRYEAFSYIKERISKTMEGDQRERKKINESNDINTIPTK